MRSSLIAPLYGIKLYPLGDPNFFYGVDPIGYKYVVLLAQCQDHKNHWLCLQVSNQRLSDLSAGKMSIPDAFQDPESTLTAITEHQKTGQLEIRHIPPEYCENLSPIVDRKPAPMV